MMETLAELPSLIYQLLTTRCGTKALQQQSDLFYYEPTQDHLFYCTVYTRYGAISRPHKLQIVLQRTHLSVHSFIVSFIIGTMWTKAMLVDNNSTCQCTVRTDNDIDLKTCLKTKTEMVW